MISMYLNWEADEDPPLAPCHVLDANGKEYSDVLNCDTESGQIIVFAKDAADNALFDQWQDRARAVINAPAPLKVIAMSNGKEF